MIPKLLWRLLVWIGRLIIPGTPPKTRIDPMAPCPACGNVGGSIKTVRQGQELFVEHDCETCKARWYEDVISKAVKTKAAGEP
jgi:hypothetical protein